MAAWRQEKQTDFTAATGYGTIDLASSSSFTKEDEAALTIPQGGVQEAREMN